MSVRKRDTFCGVLGGTSEDDGSVGSKTCRRADYAGVWAPKTGSF